MCMDNFAFIETLNLSHRLFIHSFIRSLKFQYYRCSSMFILLFSRYFDSVSNGFFYQYSGTQGWKKCSNGDLPKQQQTPQSDPIPSGFAYAPSLISDPHLAAQSVVTFVGPAGVSPVATTVFAALGANPQADQLGFLAQQYFSQPFVLLSVAPSKVGKRFQDEQTRFEKLESDSPDSADPSSDVSLNQLSEEITVRSGVLTCDLFSIFRKTQRTLRPTNS